MDYFTRQKLMNQLTEPAQKKAVELFAPPKGSKGLDVGCGLGSTSFLLAEKIGNDGLVIGLDNQEKFVDYATAQAKQNSFENTRFIIGDMNEPPSVDNGFNWIWCADVLWPGFISDPLTVLTNLKNVLRPKGKIALVYWATQTLLPGHPTLEARLMKTYAESLPYLANVSNEEHFLCAMGWLKKVGFSQIEAHPISIGLTAPFDSSHREMMACCLDMIFAECKKKARKEDWEQLQPLIDIDSPDFLPDRPEYFGIVTYTIFTGIRD